MRIEIGIAAIVLSFFFLVGKILLDLKERTK